jgi:hypothetical protein
MGNTVYANGMEVSCKASDGKSICAFPDVCFTPPLTPATPPGVPIPYPNTAMASDTSSGSSSVKIGGQEVMLKNSSFFKTSTGDEAGSAPKKNIITSKIKGKAYFIAWSMDVKVEGENVVRNMDMTTHNHASLPAGAPPTLYTALTAMGNIPACETDKGEVETKCDPWDEKAKCPEDTEGKIQDAKRTARKAKKSKGDGSPEHEAANAVLRGLYEQYSKEMQEIPCRRALRCVLIPYNKVKDVRCKDQTGDHLVENATVNELKGYSKGKAPTALVEGPSYHIGSHGLGHEGRTLRAKKRRGEFTVRKQAEGAAKEHCETFRTCNPKCIEEQLVKGHEAMGIDVDDSCEKPTLNSEHNKKFKTDYDKFHEKLAKK